MGTVARGRPLPATSMAALDRGEREGNGGGTKPGGSGPVALGGGMKDGGPAPPSTCGGPPSSLATRGGGADTPGGKKSKPSCDAAAEDSGSAGTPDGKVEMSPCEAAARSSGDRRLGWKVERACRGTPDGVEGISNLTCAGPPLSLVVAAPVLASSVDDGMAGGGTWRWLWCCWLYWWSSDAVAPVGSSFSLVGLHSACPSALRRRLLR